MRTIDLNIRVREFAFEEMNEADRHLLEQAKLATNNAYANYSKFYVGAALLGGSPRLALVPAVAEAVAAGCSWA